MDTPIVLIGPPRAGKSSVGRLLSERLAIRQVAMDSIRFEYYREIGYDDTVAVELYRAGGFWALYRYWKPFEVYAVERVLDEHPEAIIDFGAGHSVHEEPASLERVRRSLEHIRNVILLLPSPEPEESRRILRDRDPSFEATAPGFSDLCICHSSNRVLAKFIVYSAGKTEAETCDEICTLITARRG